jgi:hypothetical protein
LSTASREIACLEEPSVIDLRIAQAEWSRVKDRISADPTVRREPSTAGLDRPSLDSAADLNGSAGCSRP